MAETVKRDIASAKGDSIDESANKRVKVDEVTSTEAPPCPAARPVFGMGATGFGALSTAPSSWLKKPGDASAESGGAFAVPASNWLLKPLGGGGGEAGAKPPPFTFGQAASSGGFCFGGLTSSSSAESLTTGKKPAPFKFNADPLVPSTSAAPVAPSSSSSSPLSKNATAPSGEDGGGERGGDGNEEDQEEGGTAFSEDIESMPADKMYQRVDLPEASAEAARTGEEGEDVLLSVGRGKLYVLEKKEDKKAPAEQEALGGSFGASWALSAAASSSSSSSSSGNLPSEASAADKVVCAADTASSESDRGKEAEAVASAPSSSSSSASASASAAVLKEWRECGVGTLRVLVAKKPAGDAAGNGNGGKSGRLVMRREKTEALILNVSLLGMQGGSAVVMQGDKAVRFTCLANAPPPPEDPAAKATDSEGAATAAAARAAETPDAAETKGELGLVAVTYLLKTKSKEEAREFYTVVLDRVR